MAHCNSDYLHGWLSTSSLSCTGTFSSRVTGMEPMVFGDLNFPNLKRETVEDKTKWDLHVQLRNYMKGSEICHLLELLTKVVCVCIR